MKHHFHISSPHRQHGAVLVVSMLLLLVITVLALGASQSTRLQERMAGSQRNYDLAFQSAEAAIRAGERMVDPASMAAPPLPCAAITNPPCRVYERGYLNNTVSYADQAFQSREWWTARAQNYGTTTNLISGAAGDGLAKRDPQFYVEEVEEVADALSIPPTGPPPSRVYYRIVARGEGGTDNSQVVIHSTYVRRFN
ncbi:MAG: PilX N-terminal domain-containing pilus assembly protein [Steroidobacter sp.]